MTIPEIKLPALVRAYRDAGPEHYDRMDLQVALESAGFTAASAPLLHEQLPWFYDTFFKPPFPPLVMIATIEENRFGDLEIDLVNQRNRRYYEKLIEEYRSGHYDPSQCLIYLQGRAAGEFLQDWTPAQRRELEGGWTVRFKISRDDFDHYFGWSNSIYMGY